MYPTFEPFATHYLDVGDGHTLHIEEAGSPDGIPALFVHGGPGGGVAAFNRQFFDPDRYRVVLMDQRGSGKSTPLGSVYANTTPHLVEDLEAVRRYLRVERWMLFGGSWGSTLSLAYAQKYSERVTGLILRGIFMLRRSERNWFYQDGLRNIQPEEWDRFVAVIPPNERSDVLGAYSRRLLGDDPDEALRCSQGWARWEAVNSSLEPDSSLIDTLTESTLALSMARVMVHYLTNGGFLESENELLDGVEKIRTIPTVIIQARYDLCCPVTTAHELAKRWPEAQFTVIPAAGHSSMESQTISALIDATDSFADRFLSL
ncbi:prolyl aminopeptidase [Paramicrobacterium chengjingii]|uniref:prolyl aminopeptidase n=1 Tax=Paramicrobacterium chengjingii TaxID=2769067 RepID=UPI001AB0302F|nr:prolyl aminopeptidase [Microbacterium chengjingii]